MPGAVAIPSVGIAMTEALLVKWHKQPGEEVAADEPVAEIETDKATMDLESPVAGRLGPHLAEPGQTVAVGTVIVEVLAEGEAPRDPKAVPAATPEPSIAAAPATREPTDGAGPASEPAPAAPAVAGRRPHTLGPRARRLAAQAATAPREHERFRELIAAKVTRSWQEIPHFAVTREVDAQAMLAALDSLRAAAVEPAPTLTDLLLRALAGALAALERDRRGDVGLAVATEHGVVIPVVRGVHRLDAAGLAAARAAAVERARAGRLAPGDLEAAPPSTLSNLGPMGVDHFTGVIALGQTSLLTVGRALPRVVAGADGRLGVRTTLHATLNADHRTIDGAKAARLLVAFAEAAEQMSADP
jgi:pyruvate dehydrogenase E2 component (dihydrolipoyllysine-residue acetyltransferase)